MNQLIIKKLKELQANTNASYKDIKFVTTKEFQRSPFKKSKLNYLHFLESLNDIEIQNMINFLLLCRNN